MFLGSYEWTFLVLTLTILKASETVQEIDIQKWFDISWMKVPKLCQYEGSKYKKGNLFPKTNILVNITNRKIRLLSMYRSYYYD